MNKKLYVGNLPLVAEENQLQALFSADGRTVLSVKILLNPQTKRSRGFAFVEMGSEGDAERAIDALNGKEFLGRPLTVSEARESVSGLGNNEEHLQSPLGRKVFGNKRGASDRY
jgi:RNA recognition motif-containing protein